jgi:ribosomal protein S18 acetylase RimI-like enzyme
VLDDAELARRSILGFGETIAALGGAARAVRREDALGARIAAAAGHHWIDAVVVPFGAAPPADDPATLPHALWTVAAAAPGRVEEPSIAMPCLGLELATASLDGGERDPEPPPLAVVGDVNDRAYGQFEALGPLLGAVAGDARLRAHGVRVDGAWACVALTVRVGDDASVQYVATEARFRRRGLARRLLLAALAEARDDGARTATLQASPDGLAVYERLGFRRVALLRAFLSDRSTSCTS